MPTLTIEQLQYPAKTPSTNDLQYMCWMTNGELNLAEYRTWTASAWVLNPGEVVVSFIEIGRIAIP